ncbi:hypothetical protein HPB48_010371 [Haemaphysalis longicornis]|uniref:Uncharacterized protein n=1 Tax=Haemaphysalis longicornis TaxID=44386 RepID=A0A9J6G7W7_HAELO|nr:hypothetical protein HPB48_010371 [Haemaphysalis longicornis]
MEKPRQRRSVFMYGYVRHKPPLTHREEAETCACRITFPRTKNKERLVDSIPRLTREWSMVLHASLSVDGSKPENHFVL